MPTGTASKSETKSKAKSKPDPLDALRAAEARLEKEQEKRAELERQRNEYAAHLRSLQSEWSSLAETDPEQFGPDGLPRPKSRAAAIRRELDQAQVSQPPGIIRGQDSRVEQAEAEVRRLTDQHSEQLALAEFRAGEDEIAGLDEPASQMLAVIGQLEKRKARLTQIVNRTQGQRLSGQDIYWDPALDQLRKQLEQIADRKPPRSATLTPFPGEEPRLRRSADGGWLEHWSGQELGEQPEPVEPRR